ncbi:hypothetical protein KAR34_10345 [bacterium]|nr:hypothetical protein [bacterium]
MHTIGEYKGNAVITLKRNEEDKYAFTFGLSKAKLIMEHIDVIKAFCEENKDKGKEKSE